MPPQSSNNVELQSPTSFPGPYLRSPPAREVRMNQWNELNYCHLFPPPPSLPQVRSQEFRKFTLKDKILSMSLDFLRFADFPEISWDFLRFHEISWNFMRFHEISWHFNSSWKFPFQVRISWYQEISCKVETLCFASSGVTFPRKVGV